jgi:Flp pilus assembly protein TadD
LEEAEKNLRAATEVRPDSGEARFALGAQLERAGRSDDAQMEYLKALDAGYDDARLHFRLAVLFARRGEKDRALSHFAVAFEREPEKYVPIVREELKAVRSELDSIRYSDAFNKLLEKYASVDSPKP